MHNFIELYISMHIELLLNLTLKRLGGGDLSRDKSATRVDLAAAFHDFFL